MRAVAFVAILALGSCSGRHLDPHPGGLDTPFRVGFADHVTIVQEDLTLNFAELNEESRCPRGVVCIVAGKAVITVTVSKPGFSTEVLTLTLGGTTGSDSAMYLEYTVTLLDLQPYPVAGMSVVKSDYVATLRVTK